MEEEMKEKRRIFERRGVGARWKVSQREKEDIKKRGEGRKRRKPQIKARSHDLADANRPGLKEGI